MPVLEKLIAGLTNQKYLFALGVYLCIFFGSRSADGLSGDRRFYLLVSSGLIILVLVLGTDLVNKWIARQSNRHKQQLEADKREVELLKDAVRENVEKTRHQGQQIELLKSALREVRDAPAKKSRSRVQRAGDP